jgi:hypothetical protein
MQETVGEPLKVDWASGAEMMLEQLSAAEQARLRSSLESALRNPDQNDPKLIETASEGLLWVFRAPPNFRVFIKKLHDRLVVVDMARSEQVDFFRSGKAYEEALARRRTMRR